MSDTWLLKVPPIGEDGSCDFKKFKWEKRKNPGNPPNPVRSGAYSREIDLEHVALADDDVALNRLHDDLLGEQGVSVALSVG